MLLPIQHILHKEQEISYVKLIISLVRATIFVAENKFYIFLICDYNLLWSVRTEHVPYSFP